MIATYVTILLLVKFQGLHQLPTENSSSKIICYILITEKRNRSCPLYKSLILSDTRQTRTLQWTPKYLFDIKITERYLNGICKQVDFELYDIVDDDIFISVQNLERFTDCNAINNRCRKNQIAFCNKKMEFNVTKCQVHAAILWATLCTKIILKTRTSLKVYKFVIYLKPRLHSPKSTFI